VFNININIAGSGRLGLVLPTFAAALAPYGVLTDTTTQSSAFLPIPGLGIGTFQYLDSASLRWAA